MRTIEIIDTGISLKDISKNDLLVFQGREDERVLEIDNEIGRLWTEGPDGEGGIRISDYVLPFTKTITPKSMRKVYSLYDGYPDSLMRFRQLQEEKRK